MSVKRPCGKFFEIIGELGLTDCLLWGVGAKIFSRRYANCLAFMSDDGHESPVGCCVIGKGKGICRLSAGKDFNYLGAGPI